MMMKDDEEGSEMANGWCRRVLMEATSALDAQSEAIVQKALCSAMVLRCFELCSTSS